jgi:TetR/AcrR family transcriptional repressor of nem operon
MARRKIFDENEALQSAMLAFWKTGYKATSLQDLEQATGLKRTSLYNAFGDKRQLFELSLQRYLEGLKFFDILEKKKTAQTAIIALFHEALSLHFDKNHPGGCLVILSIMENHHHDPRVRKTLEGAIQRVRDGVVARLEKGVSAGELPLDLDCRLVGNQLMGSLAGMFVMAKANIAKKELLAMAEATVKAFLPVSGGQ